MHLDDSTLPVWLAERDLPGLGGDLRVEPAGAGNINYVRRVRAAGGGSVVVKHARRTLERFPEYEVTPERLLFEWRYGEVVRERAPEVAAVLPTPIDFDPDLPAIVMEDLGDAPHLERALLEGAAVDEALESLGRFLGAVHAATSPDASPDARKLAERFRNDAMRELHGEHIFTLPFEPNDFPIDPGVRSGAASLLERAGARAAITRLRSAYYGSARALVHADVQGTNVLVQRGRPRLLDAEIAHVGDPAFDLGIALAHVEVHAALDSTLEGPRRAARALMEGYRSAGGDPEAARRARGFAGVELLRRTLGAARFNFVESPDQALAVVRHGVDLLG